MAIAAVCREPRCANRDRLISGASRRPDAQNRGADGAPPQLRAALWSSALAIEGKTANGGFFCVLMTDRFSESYFQRYYEKGRSRVYGASQIAHLARGVTGFVRWFGGDITSVLDVGAGTGMWGAWFRKHLPSVEYRSIDVSRYACAKYGHEHRNIAKWRARQEFDLIICQGVLPYLSDAECRTAIKNMAGMCRGFLYLEAITARDLRTVCDRARTDVSVLARPASFYRRALGQHFEALGCGLHHAIRGERVFYELELGRT
jgi:hypothetical protein